MTCQDSLEKGQNLNDNEIRNIDHEYMKRLVEERVEEEL